MEEHFRPLDPEKVKNWISNIGSEIEFWEKWFRTGGLEWPQVFREYTSDSRTFPEYLKKFIPQVGTARVLDVASGPISVIGVSSHLNNDIQITCFDPLADLYNMLLDRHKLSHIPKVNFGIAEFADQFLEEQYDLIFCRNGLDHTYDPLRSLNGMLSMLSPNGYIILEHTENEAENQKYHGLHHWNFTVENENLIFWSKEVRLNVTKILGDFAEIESRLEGNPGQLRSVLSVIKLRNNISLFKPDDTKEQLVVYLRESIAEVLKQAILLANLR